MDAHANETRKPAVDGHVAGVINAELKAALCAGLTSAMTSIWEERSRHPVLSETFFALTKLWEALYAQRCREEEKGKP
ncbi:MAG: hypothetical protein HY077_03225 [Elusimicrobia bacterium]|nr:hypothetical protein [Elusimicrobiota bacterium]